MTSAKPSPHEQAANDARAPRDGGPAIDQLLAETERAIAAIEPPSAIPPRRAERFAFREFATPNAAAPTSSEGTELELKIEIGRTQVCSDDLAELRRGSVVSLDKTITEPVDIVASGIVVARGEVLVMDGAFCVRITELANHESVADDA